jgi:hypothetical protein
MLVIAIISRTLPISSSPIWKAASSSAARARRWAHGHDPAQALLVLLRPPLQLHEPFRPLLGMMATEAGIDDLAHVDDVVEPGIERPLVARVLQGQIRLDLLDLDEIVLPKDFHLVERDQPVEILRGGQDLGNDIDAAQEKERSVDSQSEEELLLHQSLM